MIKINKGLALPIAGAPLQKIENARPVRSVAVLGPDYPGVRPTMTVREGDTVKRGQLLFTDKKNEGVRFTAPASGTVSSISRGAKRVLLSVVIDVEGDAAESFGAHTEQQARDLDRSSVVDALVASGLWTAFRTRPFSKVPNITAVPHAIFVTAIDTNPLAADPAVVIVERPVEFVLGLDLLTKLTEGSVFVCQKAGEFLPAGSAARLKVEEFAGIHPAGLPGTHMHFLAPVSVNRTNWFIGYQDVIALGVLFLTGELSAERVVALGGPGVTNPRLLRTVLGASTEELTAGELESGEQRVISGCVFSGRACVGALTYVGRYHNQLSVLPEDRTRRLIGYLTPGLNKHSVFPIYMSKWLGKKTLDFSTTTNGSPRAMVPIGTYESVMPLDILATQLLRSLLTGDVDLAIKLGCLELDEEDVALCTYACPGKYEYGPVLRTMLEAIEKEG
ncbi:MAG: Na(+)-translocating NADH-quinone reductase subunit A [Proteobacteria bacterium]|nr:Na(+)-translocating NADH-quinone reductase subunit A [Pseudomonadota bacterium]